MLAYEDGVAAIEWLCHAFGLPYIINGVLVYVKDVEQHFKTATDSGATILTGLERGGPGIRYRTEDLEGQRWMFMERPTE